MPSAEGSTAQQKEKLVAQVGSPFNPLQMAGLYDGVGNLYQGTMLGIMKVAPSK